jgi:hypothetical protein
METRFSDDWIMICQRTEVTELERMGSAIISRSMSCSMEAECAEKK